MASAEFPFVLGTAGNIDHGKTALVKALSGVDCDRLAEEKKRGMTIELGFAPLTLPSGKTISVVDVPGHEKFIRQMVAGAAGIDAVMLVIAADDGVMPQTREHLDILTLLGIRHGITVINKIDAVDEEMLELAKDDVCSLISGTFLEGASILPASALTGAGLTEVANAISDLVEHGVRRSRDGAFFMPVDRAFHISGFGTVVTGTAVKGAISLGDGLSVLPSGAETKVRSIQVHSAPVESACAGQRTALNLAGVSLDNVRRGDVVAAAGCYGATECLDAEVTALASLGEPLAHWQRLRLHIGTSDVVARISLLDREKINPGDIAMAQIIPEEPVCATRDDHFILRTHSPLRTIAGGRVLLPLGERPKNKAARAALMEFLTTAPDKSGVKELLPLIVEYRGEVLASEAIKMLEASQRDFTAAVTSLDVKGRIGVVKTGETTLMSLAHAGEIRDRLVTALGKFHKAHPERKGMDVDEAAQNLSITDSKFVRELLRMFRRLEWVSFEDDRVKLKDFEPFDEMQFMTNIIAFKEYLKKAGFMMPSIDEASAALGLGAKDMNRAISYLKERKDLVIIGDGMILLADVENDFRSRLTEITGDITLAGFRDVTGSSRKYSLPLLEYFDSKGITRRVGDKRILLKRS